MASRGLIMTRRLAVFWCGMAENIIGVAMGRDPWMGPPLAIAASRSSAVGCQLSSGPTCSSTTANSELIDHKQLLISTSHHQHDHAPHVTPCPRVSEHGTYKTIEASIRFVVGCQLS